MLVGLEEFAPHLLGAFMIALACIPLVFAWQDQGRRQAHRLRITRLQQKARLAARLREGAAARPAFPLVADWMGEAHR